MGATHLHQPTHHHSLVPNTSMSRIYHGDIIRGPRTSEQPESRRHRCIPYFRTSQDCLLWKYWLARPCYSRVSSPSFNSCKPTCSELLSLHNSVAYINTFVI